VAIDAAELTACQPRNEANAGPIHGGPGRERMDETDFTGLKRALDAGFADLFAERHPQIVRAAHQRDFGGGRGGAHGQEGPWKVRLMTSICCSRVKRTKFTA
jgi:hypothetical protein